jgi:hypothetical protein
MTEIELSSSVRLSCQRALLGAITPNIRLITIGWDSLDMLYLKAYYNTLPSEDNIKDMNIVMSEIHADIPFKKDNGTECIYDIRPINQLEFYKWIVYSRKES